MTSTVPVPRHSYYGREALRQQIVSILLDDAPPRMVVISGPPGIGKTFLSQTVAIEAKSKFPDGCHFIQIGGKRAVDIRLQILSLIAPDESPAEDDATHSRLQSTLHSWRACIVLDRVTNDDVSELIKDCSQSFFVITTTDASLFEQLGVPSRNHFPLDQLTIDEAIGLLSHFAGPSKVDDDRDSAVEVVRRLGGWPLGLKIIGTRIQTDASTTLKDVLRRLQERSAGSTPSNFLVGEELVETSFRLAIDDLEPRQQQLLLALSACGDTPFSWRRANAIEIEMEDIPTPPLDLRDSTSRLQDQLFRSLRSGSSNRQLGDATVGRLADLRTALNSLVSKHLLESTEIDGEQRFEFHSEFHHFLTREAHKCNVASKAPFWHANYFIACVLRAFESKTANEYQLNLEFGEIWQVVENIEQNRVPAHWLFVFALERLLEDTGRHRFGLSLCQRMARHASNNGHVAIDIELGVKCSRYLSQTHQYDDALAELDRCDALIGKLQSGNYAVLISCIVKTQRATVLLKRRPQNVVAASEALDEAEELANRLPKPDQLWRVWCVRERTLQCDDAISLLQRVADLSTNARDWATSTVCHTAIARRLREAGRRDEAMPVLERAILASRNGNSTRSLVMALSDHGILARQLGQMAIAALSLRQAVDLSLTTDDRRRLATLLRELSAALHGLGQTEEAETRLRQALAMALRTGDRREYAKCLQELRRLIAFPRNRDPEHFPTEILSALMEIDQPDELVRAVSLVFANTAHRSTKDDADRIVRSIEVDGADADRYRSHAARARALLSSDQLDRSVIEWRQSIDSLRDSNEHVTIGECWLGLGLTLYRMNRFQDSMDASLKALQLVIGEIGMAASAIDLLLTTCRACRDFSQGRHGLELLADAYANRKLSSTDIRELFGVARQAFYCNIIQSSIALLEIAREGLLGASDSSMLGRVLNVLAQAYLTTDDLKNIDEVATAIRSVLRSCGDEALTAALHRTLGFIALRSGDTQAARAAWDAGLQWTRSHGHEKNAARFEVQIAIVDIREGDVAAARDRLLRNVGAAVTENDWALEIVARPLLASAYIRLDEISKAHVELLRAHELAKGTDRRRVTAQITTRLAAVCTRLGRLDEAEVYLREAATIEEMSPNERGLARVIGARAAKLIRENTMGSAQQALELLVPLLEVERRIHNPLGQAIVLHDIGRARSILFAWKDAEIALRESIEIGRRLRMKRHQAIVLESLGSLLHRTGRIEESLEPRMESVALGEALHDASHLAHAYLGLSRSLVSLRKFDELPKFALKAFAIYANPERDWSDSKRRYETMRGLLFDADKSDVFYNAVADVSFPWQVGGPDLISFQGTVKVYKEGRDGRRYGFINQGGRGPDIFFAADRFALGLMDRIAVGSMVRGTARRHEDKLQAQSIDIESSHEN